MGFSQVNGVNGMCLPAEIDVYWSDEQIISLLNDYTRGISRLPDNVLEESSPYEYPPSNLPGGFWYLFCLNERKEHIHGFWRAKGDSCNIYSNSSINGWRTTLEYFEGKAPNEQRTDWVMQEYSVTQKDLCDEDVIKESRLLCRVFLSSGLEKEMHPENCQTHVVESKKIESIEPITVSCKDSKSESRMCPPAEIDVFWSDEQIISLLNEYVRGISRLPENVLEESSPYEYPPSNLPGGFWYLVCLNERKEYVHGFWRAKGDSCNIYSNSSINGWRTTLEYFEGKAPNEQRTDWVMQEYKVTKKDLCDEDVIKESRLLCRVFLSSGPENEMHPENCKTHVVESKKIESIEPITISWKDSKSESKMCPPAEIDVFWSDEQIISLLNEYVRGISRLPENVLEESSPYEYPPSNLPGGFWYLVCLNERKEYVHGFWRAKGDSCNIYSNSSINGWRTTLEYFEGKAPNEQRTDWVMQEYKVTKKDLCDEDVIKESRLLCRVFLSSGPENEMHPENCKTHVVESKKIESIEPITISWKDSKSESKMCPPAEIDVYWSDEQIILLLNEYIRGISRLPENVLEESSPYEYPPSNLPGGFWYLVCLNERKEYVHGFWRAKGDSCNIYSNSSINGWRTTLEYFEGKAPNEQRTDWVMQEYRVTQKDLCDKDVIKESRLLCRVFLSREPEKEIHPENCKTHVVESKKIESIEPNTISCKDSKSESKAKTESEVGALSSPQVFSEVLECFSRGDFLELDDLEDPESHTSNSQDLSCPSKFSDEYFDSSALLRDLEEDENNYIQRQQSSSRYDFPSSVVSNNVVLQTPASSNTLHIAYNFQYL